MQFLLAQNSRLKLPTTKERREILDNLNLAASFSRAYDLVLLPPGKTRISDVVPGRLVLVELKTTRKQLENNPNGFFFGATENEFQLAKKLERSYLFCFVSLHPQSRSYSLITLSDLEKRIKTKRVQYQINL